MSQQPARMVGYSRDFNAQRLSTASLMYGFSA